MSGAGGLAIRCAAPGFVRDDLVRRQAAEIDELRERVRQLEGLLAPPDLAVRLQVRFGLTRAEATLLATLVRHQVMTRPVADAALATIRRDRSKICGDKLVETMLVRLRRRLPEHVGAGCRTFWGTGWSLTPDARARIAADLAAAEASG